MTTSQDIIDNATVLLRVRASGNTYLEDDASRNGDVFIALQNLIAEWVEDQVIDIPAPALVADALDIPPGTARALSYNLAVEVVSQFGKTLEPSVYAIAEKTLDRLEADMTLDISVDMSDLSFSFGRYNIETDR
tara:strand:+ start:4327 stop:4728 length:402 start_codon:yes stop_codon:yes gene_type:complete